MGMTMTQKILAAHAGMDHVEAGQLIEADLDMVLGNDITSPVAIREFEKYGFKRVFDPGKVAMVMDHFAPNKDIKAAQQCKACRTFAFAKHIEHFYDVGEMGIEHALLPEKGIVGPGECIIGADSHTCTYGALGAFSTGVGSTDMAAGMATGKCWFKVPEAIRFNLSGSLQPNVSGKDVILHIIGMIGVDGALYRSMEFTGEGVKNLTMDDRLCICNMAIEAGAKNGIFEVDDVTRAYVKDRVNRPYQEYHADADAEYVKTYDIDLSAIRPTVAFPHLPENTHTVDEIAEPIRIDQVVIGSCTNGRIPIWRLRLVSWRASMSPKGCAASSSQRPRAFTRNVCTAVIWTSSSMPAASSLRRHAVHAWAATWASWQKESAASPRPTAISSAAWDMWILRSIWPARPSRLPARSPA